MNDVPPDVELQRVRRERDLYRRLLELNRQSAIDPFLEEALALIVDVTGAELGYLEIRENGDEAWSTAVGFSAEQLENVRRHVSQGILAEALATGKTIQTHSAILDERFRERESVQEQRIEAVLCAPVGGDAARGAIYLQGRAVAGPFSAENRLQVELLARHLAPLAERLLVRRRYDAERDPTRALRARYHLDGVVGRSGALAVALEQAMLAAPLDVNVFLTGQSGTGKSQLARAIHDNGRRRGRPFVEVNCGAIPETLVESELFGALAGSHSTARTHTEGKVGAAEGGTLFLDEVADLPYDAQAKLLQLLQSKRYYRLGASTPSVANVRVIAATNRDLEEAVSHKTFREDLYYRLQVLPIRMPALAERRADIPDLAVALCARIAARDGLAPLPFSSGAVRALCAAEWPGNIRQLENAIEAGLIRAHGAEAAEVSSFHLFPDRPRPADADEGPLTYQAATHEFQRELLQRTLDELDWNVTAAARRLGLARSHVYNLISALGLRRKPRR